ncbi:endonuclease domain-containing protein [Acidaminococcus timonensis]|jgi:very-short-patch-repair endonuclease|uniref:endonuclease domain-containing protein n=1 Tax=Acidaminococcus timonensis TaxID=1871002 RepID=UPI003A5BCCF0
MYYETSSDRRLKQYARTMRRHMTPEERHLWFQFLQSYPVRFLRQKILAGYIVDFYCARARLIVEIDGGQHYAPGTRQYDSIRTRELSRYGFKVLRFTNRDIWRNFDGVMYVIDKEVKLRMEEGGEEPTTIAPGRNGPQLRHKRPPTPLKRRAPAYALEKGGYPWTGVPGFEMGDRQATPAK